MSEIDISIDQLGMQVICERVRLLGGGRAVTQINIFSIQKYIT